MKNVKFSLGHHLTTTGKGRQFEVLARKFLGRQGLKQFQLNFHSRFGEIDLIARDADILVFIEVRYRKTRIMVMLRLLLIFTNNRKLFVQPGITCKKMDLPTKCPADLM